MNYAQIMTRIFIDVTNPVPMPWERTCDLSGKWKVQDQQCTLTSKHSTPRNLETRIEEPNQVVDKEKSIIHRVP